MATTPADEAPRARLERWLEAGWYERARPRAALVPLAGLFGLAVAVRRSLYRLGLSRSERVPCPVLVVGNVTVGGSGKTPLVAWLAQRARARGLRVGIVSRGHGGAVPDEPLAVTPDADPSRVGDEPLLLARCTGAPVVVCRHRARAARVLADAVDLILADDGLQHYALARDGEIAVVDAERRLGNGWLLPAGPLREPASRLAAVDLVVERGSEQGFDLQPVALRQVGHPRRTMPLAALANADRLVAVAAIARPGRFFASVAAIAPQARVATRSFPDHWAFRPADLADLAHARVVMTAKDAVKCKAFAGADWWALEVAVVVAPALVRQLDALLARLTGSPDG